jgi:hypothetical protein
MQNRSRGAAHRMPHAIDSALKEGKQIES